MKATIKIEYDDEAYHEIEHILKLLEINSNRYDAKFGSSMRTIKGKPQFEEEAG